MKSTKMCVDFYDAINTEDILVSMIKRNSEKKKERKKKEIQKAKFLKKHQQLMEKEVCILVIKVCPKVIT